MMQHAVTLGELCEMVGGELRGARPDILIAGVASIADSAPDEITWLSHPRFVAALRTCRAAAVITSAALGDVPVPAILTADPEQAVACVLERFRIPIAIPDEGVHVAAVVAPNAKLGAGVRIGAFVHVGPDAYVGDGCVLHPGVRIGSGCKLGAGCEIFPNVSIGDRGILRDRVVLKPGAVVGSDGFGFIFRDGVHRRIPHVGIVILEDDVEVGANSCIDRAKVGATVIGRGTKIDNLVQIAHNCRLGAHCILVGQVGISGSVSLGNGVIMGGRAGATDGVGICDSARIGGTAIVTKNITVPGDYAGMPARPRVEHNRAVAAIRRAHESRSHVKQLERRVAELEALLHGVQSRIFSAESFTTPGAVSSHNQQACVSNARGSTDA